MYGKILIRCKMIVLTGMHIGGFSAFSAIGAVDSPIIRDTFTNEPIVPGSSLKGKMRTLLAKAIKNDYITQPCKYDPEEIKRLFGSAGNKQEKENPKTARLQFADAFLTNADLLKRRRAMTEVKFENTINRLTAEANPRQIERVAKGAQFAINLVYDMEKADEIEADFANIARSMKLLSMDYLGGHGSRGYGRVAFSDFIIETKFGECPVDIDLLLNILKEVEEYGLLSLQA
ncbi:MAG TPA: type III-A CRISPR-associated RAMP protein Csm3 [Syntrophomonadaceae bacterium]|nr:type III-A CRISPR-associated RAMP protein Csm3 [Syntrophomonadaceae bacterium]